MKTATPFFSDFFQTDCLVIDGEPHFSITGATRTLYGNAGGAQLSRLGSQIQKMYGVANGSSAVDLSKMDGFCPVLVERSGRGTVEALAMNQDAFKALLKMYRGKKSNAGRYADVITNKLVDVAMDLILRKEAGLLHEEAAKAVNESILSRTLSAEAQAKVDSLLSQQAFDRN